MEEKQIKSGRILVIDDELDFLDSIKRGLIIAGYRDFVLLSQPLQIKELLKHQSFDLVFIDFCMPQMGGLEVLEYILTAAPQTKCIILTALADAQIAIRSLEMGAWDFLTKPITRDKLINTLTQALDNTSLPLTTPRG
jgi:DNA-binding NtrC family response regulator